MTSTARTASAVAKLADEQMSVATSETDLAVRLHDAVRDRVAFGFTPYFDAAPPEATLRHAVGHCNPQAALMVALFREAGFEARFQPVTITSDVLRGVAVTPPFLSHVFSEVRIGDRWCRLDSYIVDLPLRRAAVARLRAEGRELGYGCHVDASDWDGGSDAFSQIAKPELVVEKHAPVDHIEEFYRSPSYLHTAAGVRYTTLLAPLRPACRMVTPVMNLPTRALRRGQAAPL